MVKPIEKKGVVAVSDAKPLDKSHSEEKDRFHQGPAGMRLCCKTQSLPSKSEKLMDGPE